MRIKTITRALLFAALLLAVPAIASAAGHIAPTGVTSREASQLVVWYDQGIDDGLDGASIFQVTNGSTDTAVNIHVQIFADDSFDPTELCREHDFNDTLTPSDTIVYIIGELDNPFDCAPCLRGGNNSHAPIPIDVDFTRGFIVVTAVDTVTLPRQAISHNHLFGSMFINESVNNDDRAMSFKAMGRQAVDFATGALLGNGVLLDGVTTGLRLIQPSFHSFGFNDRQISHSADNRASINSITITDNYSDPNGEYRAEPATAVWDPLMFDHLEVGTSCQQHINFCFVSLGLNDSWDAVVDRQTNFDGINLCPAVETDADPFFGDHGWAKIAVSGISGLDSHFGIMGLNRPSRALASWMTSE